VPSGLWRVRRGATPRCAQLPRFLNQTARNYDPGAAACLCPVSMPTLMRLSRILRRRITKQLLILALVIFSIYEVVQILHCLSSTTTEPVVRRPERVYIASLHWNNEKILRSHWNDAVVALAIALGPENVFVTVYESGSWDESKDALRELDKNLEAHNIRRNVTLSDVTHKDELAATDKGSGWIDTPKGTRELRRIPYLARLRNWTLEPLQELYKQGERFDKVLFLNDVVFNVRFLSRALCPPRSR
jgi:hypothetical protein